MKRSVLILLILLCAPLAVFSQSVWQGSCAVGSYGSFPSTGFYAASNAFPQNTLVTVVNPQTQKRTTVLVIDRLPSSGLFMLISKDAGSAIGLSGGQVAQVQVTLSKQPRQATRGPGDLPYSPDPDVFPAAGAGNPLSLSFLDHYLNQGKAPATAVPSGGPSSGTSTSGPTAGSSSTGSSSTGPKKPASRPELALAPSSRTQAPAGAPSQAKTSPAPPSAAPPQPVSPAAPSAPAAEGQTTPPAREIPVVPQVAQAPLPPAGSGRATPATPAVPAPIVSSLSPIAAPAEPPGEFPVSSTPRVPAHPGGVPILTELEQLSSPGAAPGQVALPASLPEVRNPGPVPGGPLPATPPEEQAPTQVAEVPRAPQRQAGGPFVSALLHASPSGPLYALTVESLPGVPSQAAPTAQGPMVSTLASAVPPNEETAVASRGLPHPGASSLKPSVHALLAAAPPQAASPGVVSPPAVGPTPVAAPPHRAAKKAPSAPQAAPAQPVQASKPRFGVRPESALAAGSYYVQIGAYYQSKAAVTLAANLSPDYPVSVYAFDRGKKPLYKVMVGPLNWAESGTLLYLFIDQGYSGAFIRKGK